MQIKERLREIIKSAPDEVIAIVPGECFVALVEAIEALGNSSLGNQATENLCIHLLAIDKFIIEQLKEPLNLDFTKVHGFTDKLAAELALDPLLMQPYIDFKKTIAANYEFWCEKIINVNEVTQHIIDFVAKSPIIKPLWWKCLGYKINIVSAATASSTKDIIKELEDAAAQIPAPVAAIYSARPPISSVPLSQFAGVAQVPNVKDLFAEMLQKFKAAISENSFKIIEDLFACIIGSEVSANNAVDLLEELGEFFMNQVSQPNFMQSWLEQGFMNKVKSIAKGVITPAQIRINFHTAEYYDDHKKIVAIERDILDPIIQLDKLLNQSSDSISFHEKYAELKMISQKFNTISSVIPTALIAPIEKFSELIKSIKINEIKSVGPYTLQGKKITILKKLCVRLAEYYKSEQQEFRPKIGGFIDIHADYISIDDLSSKTPERKEIDKILYSRVTPSSTARRLFVPTPSTPSETFWQKPEIPGAEIKTTQFDDAPVGESGDNVDLTRIAALQV